MNIYSWGPLALALDAASGLLHLLSTALAPVAGANAAALAIVVLTILVRLVLIPVGVSQARAQRVRDRLAPRLTELRRRHGTDPARLQRETLHLYASEGASPLAGCLPLLLQAPVLWIVYALFALPVINGHANDLLSHALLGSPLGTSFVAAVQGGPPVALIVTALVLALIGAIGLLARRATLAHLPAGQAQTRALRGLSWLPLATVLFAAFVPLAASLYLAVTTAWTLGERAALRGRAPRPRA